MTTRLLAIAAFAGSVSAAGAVGYYVSGTNEPSPVVESVRPGPADTLERIPAPTPGRTPEAAPPPATPRRAEPTPDRRVERRTPPSPAPEPSTPPVTRPVAAPTLPVATTGAPAVAATVADLPAPVRPRTELTVEADSVVGVRLEGPVSSATAKVEDPISAIVTRDVMVLGRTAIPAGSLIEGHVSFVEPGGKFREKARIGLRFTTLVLGRGERLPIQTEIIYRDGESPGPEATSKIGASAVVGTVLGAIIGGKKGAAIGGAAGAAGGTAVVAAGNRNDATLPGGATLTLRLIDAVVIVVDREP